MRLAVSQSVGLGVELSLRLMARYLFLFDSYGLNFCGAPSLTRGRFCLLCMLLALASAIFLGFESLGTPDQFYCLRFETSSLFIKVTVNSHCDRRPDRQQVPGPSLNRGPRPGIHHCLTATVPLSAAPPLLPQREDGCVPFLHAAGLRQRSPLRAQAPGISDHTPLPQI